MGVFAGPKITGGNTALTLDANNLKSYDKYENLALNSEQIGSWANNGNAVTISSNSQIAPDGTPTADVLSQSAVTGASRWVSSTGNYVYTGGVTYTISIWLKKISGTSQPSIRLWVNGFTEQSVGTITTEWVRYSATFTATTTNGSSTFTGINIGWNENGAASDFTFAAWGLQMERSSTPTEYYRTTTTRKLRGTSISDVSGNNRNTELSVTDTSYKVYDFEVGDYVIPNSPPKNLPSFSDNSIIFDGSGNYLNFSNLNLGSAITVEMLIKLGTNYSNKIIISFGDYTVWCGFGGLGYNTSNSDLYGISSANVSSLGLVNNWKYFTFEMRSDVSYNNNKLYINGQNRTLSQQTGSELSANRNFNNGSGRISSWARTTGYEIPMNMAFVRIYNRTFTAAEVLQNFNSTRGRYGL